MMKSRTCVITVNYKNTEDTAACVASLQDSTVPVSIVVVDNTPHDPDLENALSPYADVMLIRAPENLGFGVGNNLGIKWVLKKTACEFVLILNNDATIKPNAIQQMEDAMDKHPEVGIIAARIVLLEDESILWYGGGEVDWRRGGGKVPGVLGPADAPLAMQARYVSFASGCAMMIRSEILRTYGGFDERFFMYEEDLEICLRIINNGWKILYEPLIVILHVGQGSLRDKQGGKFMGAWEPENPNLPFYVYHILRNRLLTMNAYAFGKNRRMFQVYFPLFLMAKLFRFALHRRWSAIGAMFNGWQAYKKEIRKE